jgi:hypothetical protein
MSNPFPLLWGKITGKAETSDESPSGGGWTRGPACFLRAEIRWESSGMTEQQLSDQLAFPALPTQLSEIPIVLPSKKCDLGSRIEVEIRRFLTDHSVLEVSGITVVQEEAHVEHANFAA